MNGLSSEMHEKLVELRRKGKSIPEISRETGIAKTTVLRHVTGIKVPPELLVLLKEKQGGAKDRATALRSNVAHEAQALLGVLSERDHLLLLIGLYWGEGTKRDFSIINSDPSLIQAFILCLRSLGISSGRLSLSLRVHSDINIQQAKIFWSSITGLPQERIGRIEVIEGKKKGKLAHGMCRVRIRSGIRERLTIQTAISLIGKDSAKKVVSAL